MTREEGKVASGASNSPFTVDHSIYVSASLSTEGCWTHLLSWGPIDLVVSNPPYVFHKDMEQLAPEICRYRVGRPLEKLCQDPSMLEDFCLEKMGGAQRDSSVERCTLAPTALLGQFLPLHFRLLEVPILSEPPFPALKSSSTCRTMGRT